MNSPMNKEEKFDSYIPRMHPEFLLIWHNLVTNFGNPAILLEKVSSFIVRNVQPKWGESQVIWEPVPNCRICIDTGWAEYEGHLVNPQQMAKAATSEESYS